jgi:hypothetical protein
VTSRNGQLKANFLVAFPSRHVRSHGVSGERAGDVKTVERELNMHVQQRMTIRFVKKRENAGQLKTDL